MYIPDNPKLCPASAWRESTMAYSVYTTLRLMHLYSLIQFASYLGYDYTHMDSWIFTSHQVAAALTSHINYPQTKD
jgi:hypothetical protein